jgi:hypothetical protein
MAIQQNCISQFHYTSLIAFFMRLVVFLLVFTSFPLLMHFFRANIIKICFGGQISKGHFILVTTLILLIPANISVFFPNIADILSYVGSVGGLFIIYLLPVVSYL